MSVTYEGPIRIRRRNPATNDGTNLLPDDTGAVIASQDVTITFPAAGEVPICRIPAGSSLHNIRILSASTVVAGGGNIPINFTPFGGSLVNIANITFAAPAVSTTAIYLLGVAIAPTFAQSLFWQNSGLVDGTISINTGLPAGVTWYVTTQYTVRNTDGSILPYGQGLTNNGQGAPVF